MICLRRSSRREAFQREAFQREAFQRGSSLGGRDAAPRRLGLRFCLALVACGGAETTCVAVASEVPSGAQSVSPAESEPLPGRAALAVLQDVLASEARWIKVHAAEALVELGYPQFVEQTFREELDQHGEEPEYRIGIWRVLARCAESDDERRAWAERMREVFRDRQAPDRLHAAESLAKLKAPIPRAERALFAAAAEGKDPGLALFAAWALTASEHADLQEAIAIKLQGEDPITRLRAAVIVQYLRRWSPENLSRLRTAAESEPANSVARSALLAALFVRATAAGDGPAAAWSRAELAPLLVSDSPADQRFAALALAAYGSQQDLSQLDDLLADEDPDVRAAGALATLRILRRVDRRLGAFDWIVIGCYAVGMVGIGWYCARRASSAEEYLLGGRTMKPWAVGLSLFATLLSTISYLAIPGEMIRHGPMVIAQIVAFPLIYLVVGWLLIPRFMQLEVTSAYELLETRLGVSVRLLGALFFLVMRLFWMAVIVYATVDKVLIPLLGWDPSRTPFACALLGTITVIYTSLGGIRAVVITDVIQTLILLLGAGLAMAVITLQLGGVAQWWPHTWNVAWDPLKFWFDPGSRVTVAAVLVSVFTWHVCTAGSDQMAVQRYLSTRDAPAARRMFATSLAVNALALSFLACLGLALLAFFRSHPELLRDGQTISAHADQLLPRFIVIGLPPGVSGLIVAALLAAAMSSLSSGINSSCSIITVDFYERLRRNREVPADHLRLARYVSWILGAVVVLLSSTAEMVPGNLLEVTYRVVNLLVGPLFALFFMALFVPWATSAGTLAGAACSVATAVGIAFFDLGGLSFLWVLPGSLLAGIAGGAIASLLPSGRQLPAD